MSQSFTFPAPAAWINANHRTHWRRKALLTKAWRSAAWVRAYHHELKPVDRARITITIAFCDKRRRDVGNLQPTAKAIVDGLIDAHILPDDDDAHLVGPDLRRGEPTTDRLPQITVTIDPLPVTTGEAGP